MSYSKVNLKHDVKDSAEGFGLAPDLEARFATDDLATEESGIGYERLAPNFRMPFGHRHKTQEEVYVVVSGSGRVKLDDEVVEFEQWDVIRVPGSTTRCFEAGPDGAELVAFGAPKVQGDRQAEAEMDMGWWQD